jgi:hypothetical protein
MAYLVKFKSKYTGNEWKQVNLLHSRKRTANMVVKNLMKADSLNKEKKVPGFVVKIIPINADKAPYNTMTILN